MGDHGLDDPVLRTRPAPVLIDDAARWVGRVTDLVDSSLLLLLERMAYRRDNVLPAGENEHCAAPTGLER